MKLFFQMLIEPKYNDIKYVNVDNIKWIDYYLAYTPDNKIHFYKVSQENARINIKLNVKWWNKYLLVNLKRHLKGCF